jgi:hypothetical protein
MAVCMLYVVVCVAVCVCQVRLLAAGRRARLARLDGLRAALEAARRAPLVPLVSPVARWVGRFVLGCNLKGVRAEG